MLAIFASGRINRMDNDRNLKLGIVFSYITMIASVVVSLTYTPFMLRMLGQQQYGLYNMGQAAVSYLSLTEFGFGNAVVRYASKYRAEGNEKKTANLYGVFMYIYNLLAAIVLVVGTIICIFSSKFYTVSSGVEGYHQLKIIIMIMVLNLAFTFSTTTYSSIITAYERFTFLKVTNLLYILLKPVVMIPLLIWGYKAVAMSIVTFILTIGLNVANIIYVKNVLKVTINMDFHQMDFSIVKEIIEYSFFIFLGSIVSQLNDNTDNIILGIISGETAVAIYSVGYQLNAYIQQIPGVVSSVFFPRVTTRVTQGASMNEMTNLSIKIGRIQYYISFLLCSGFCLFGQEFVNLWTGEGYELAYWIVVVLIVPAVIPNIQSIPVLVIQALNKHQFKAILYVICALFNVLFSVPAALKFGPLGCAVCTGITTLLTKGIIINWYYSKRIHLRIREFWRNILMLTVKFVPLLFVGIVLNILFDNFSWISLFIKILVYSVCFIIYSFQICFNKEEKEMVKSVLRKMGLDKCIL